MLRVMTAFVLVVAALAACGSGSDGTAASSGEGATAGDPSGGSAAAGRAAQNRGVRLVKVGDFDAPLYVTAPPGDRRRIFVVEQAGRIMVVRGGKTLGQPFLDIRSKVTSGGEQGLLSLAFAPDYARSGLFYVYYTEKSGTQSIWEYHRATADTANPGSARLVLRMQDPEPNHNGGLMIFGSDRLMYVGTGDGGGGNDQHGARGNAQSLDSLLGKILRIDPRRSGNRPYTVPASNPFVGRSGARPEIYSYGLRNPWRFSFDRTTGDLSIGDVGQDQVEEINFVRKGRGRGANFGWRPWEGRRRNFNEPAPGAIFPVITHSHSEGWCSITGGYVVRDRGVPGLYGRYVYGDFCNNRLRVATLRAGRHAASRTLNVPPISGVSS
ncbi:MAG TPA: PQQ-dependent sugar dehydrogenase, partial [Solirubrobacteraceae bacterium]|nr:PQQ-dependent sugar dehydrogenase [Solirubrobacteraceae bacterium]